MGPDFRNDHYLSSFLNLDQAGLAGYHLKSNKEMIETVQYVACLFQLDWLRVKTFKSNVFLLSSSYRLPTQDEPRSSGSSSLRILSPAS
jgi:hypothetical protein